MSFVINSELCTKTVLLKRTLLVERVLSGDRILLSCGFNFFVVTANFFENCGSRQLYNFPAFFKNSFENSDVKVIFWFSSVLAFKFLRIDNFFKS